VHGVVTARGFNLVSPDSKWTGKFNIVSWTRRSWKDDMIRLGWRTQPPADCFLDAEWAVPRPDGRKLPAAGILPASMRRGVPCKVWPARFPLLGAILEGRWRAEVMADLEFALAWLDRCSSSASALEDLKRPDRNGPGAGTEAYAYIERYVREHAGA
jgi:hypothetical protein